MKLYYTPLSHFSRKVRLVLDHFKAEYELEDVGSVASLEAAHFADNPLMNVPVLKSGNDWLIDSDHIAMYLARKYDPSDRLNIAANSLAVLNARAVMNGIMQNDVKLVLGERTGINIDDLVYFQKSRKSIAGGLLWLQERVHLLNGNRPTYLDFHFISMWDHLKYFGLVDLKYSRLEAVATALSQHPEISRSAIGEPDA